MAVPDVDMPTVTSSDAADDNVAVSVRDDPASSDIDDALELKVTLMDSTVLISTKVGSLNVVPS